jgi:L-asparaginase/beta-aspartyl-peptidase (threonine type)
MQVNTHRRRLSWPIAVAIVFVAGCDAVRVEQLDHIADGRPAEHPQRGALVAFGPAFLSGVSLEQTIRDRLALLGNARESIDAAAQIVVGLETAVCSSLAHDGAAHGCAGLAMESDAAVMDGRGRFGGVVAVRGAPHPTQLARLVAETPFMALVGEGALALSGAVPQAPLSTSVPAAAAARAPTPPRQAVSRDGGASSDSAAATEQADPPRDLSSDGGLPSIASPSPSPAPPPLNVGAMNGYGVALRLGEHDFAAAVSTAGALRIPRGRMTAVPVVGAAIFAGPEGAVAATGNAGHLIRTQLARQVYQRMVGGLSPKEAATWAAETTPEGSTVNIVVINRTGSHAASSRHSHAVTLSFSQSSERDAVTVSPAR